MDLRSAYHRLLTDASVVRKNLAITAMGLPHFFIWESFRSSSVVHCLAMAETPIVFKTRRPRYFGSVSRVTSGWRGWTNLSPFGPVSVWIPSLVHPAADRV